MVGTAAPVQAAAGINKTLNFQGRLLTNAGAVVADGNYNMRFKVYQDGPGNVAGDTGGTLMWTELWQNSVATGSSTGVVVKNGYFSVNLGTYCAFAGGSCQGNSNTAVDFNQDTLWLSMDVAGTAVSNTPTYDGELLPMKRLASAVYALQANSCTTCILQAPTSTAQNTITPTVNSVVGLTVNGTSGTAATAVNIVQAGAASNLTLSNTGATSQSLLSVSQSTSSYTGTAILVNVANGSGTFASGAFVDLQANGASKFKIDNLGALTLAGGQTADITTLAGTTPTALVFQPGNTTTATSTGASFTLQAGNDSGATSSTGGLLTLKGGNATGGNQTGGGVLIDSGSGTTGGTINVGTANAGTINIATNAAAHTVAIASGAAVQGVTIGSTNSTSILTLQSGTLGTTLNTSGNFTLKNGSNNLLAIDPTGNTTFKPSTDSTSAFQTLRANAEVALKVDTSNNRVKVGDDTAASYATIALVGQATNSATAVTSLTTTRTTTSGNLLVLSVGTNSTSGTFPTGVTDTAGNTWVQAGTTYGASLTGSRTDIWYAVNAASVTSVTVAMNNAVDTTTNLSEYSGVDTSNPFDAAGTNVNTTTTTHNTASVTAAGAGELLIGNMSYNTSASTTGPGGSWTSLTNVNLGTVKFLRTAYQVVPSGGSYSATWTSSVNVTSGSVLAAFKPAQGLTSTLFVLDTSPTSTAPSGVNGGMYYDTTLNRFQCYENSVYVNCSSAGSLVQAPTSTAQNTITPTVNSVVGLTVNGTSGTAATALNVVQTGAATALTVSQSANAANLALTNTGATSSSLLTVTQSSSAYTGTALLVNMASGSGSFASGNFLDLQTNATSKFKVASTGAVTVAGGQTADITTAAAATATALVFQPGNSTGATSTGAAFTLQAGSSSGATTSTGGLLTLKGGDATGGSQTAGNVTIDAGAGTNAGTISLGTANAGTVNIANNSAAHTINIGSTTGAGATTIQGGTGGITLGSSGTIAAKSTTNTANAFQIQNSDGTNQINVNTLKTDINLWPNPSFEQNINGVVGHNTGTVSHDGTTAAQFGTASLKLVTGNTANNGAEFRFPFKGGATYNISMWMKLSATTAGNSVSIGRADNGSDTDCVTGLSLTTTWTQYTCTASFTTGTTIGASSAFYVKIANTTGITAYIDGVTLVANGTALTYTLAGSALQVEPYANQVVFNAGNNPEIQPWKANPNQLLANRSRPAVATANGYVYIMGGGTGVDGGTPTNTVYYAKQNADGTLGTSTLNANNLTSNISGAGAAVINGFIYVIGGNTTGAAPSALVQYARLNADGSTGVWSTTTALPSVRDIPGVTAYGGSIQVMGGDSGSGVTVGTTVYGKVNPDGTITSWTAGGALSVSTENFNPVIANGNVYAVGGANAGPSISTVQYAPLGSNGSIGTWATTTSLPAIRSHAAAFISNGYIYAMGGWDSTATAPVTTVYSAPLLGDGTVGAWVTSANPIPIANSTASQAGLEEMGAVMLNGYMYLIGGDNNGANGIKTIYYTSGARVKILGSLDLTSNNATSTDPAGGGQLTAGNTNIVGTLQVAGNAFLNSANFSGDLNVSGNITLGSGLTDTTQVNLQLDSFSTYADTGTCSATTNQGAVYYNTNTNSIRACQDSSWSDVISTKDAGLLMFGIVPDSGPTGGDLAGVNATDTSDGPCKVYMGSVANSVRWTGCTLYANGRRQVIAAQTSNFTTGITTTASAFQNLCIFTAGSAPTFGTANATETSASLPGSWTENSPSICLATIKEIAAGSGIGAIYDTRVFTNSIKIPATIATASNVGFAVKLNNSLGQAAPTAATTDPFYGVVASYSGSTATTSINAILVVGGPVYVKASAGSIGAYIRPTATTGYVNTGALVTTAQTDIPYSYLGLAQTSMNAPGTQCSTTANADTCRGSVLTNINIR